MHFASKDAAEEDEVFGFVDRDDDEVVDEQVDICVEVTEDAEDDDDMNKLLKCLDEFESIFSPQDVN